MATSSSRRDPGTVHVPAPPLGNREAKDALAVLPPSFFALHPPPTSSILAAKAACNRSHEISLPSLSGNEPNCQVHNALYSRHREVADQRGIMNAIASSRCLQEKDLDCAGDLGTI